MINKKSLFAVIAFLVVELVASSSVDLGYSQNSSTLRLKEIIQSFDLASVAIVINRYGNYKNFTNSTIKCLKAFSSLTMDQRLKMMDATGKVAAGILYDLHRNWIGNYRECLDTKGTTYCLQSGLKLFDVYSFSLGLCVPNICTGSDVNHIMKWLSKYGNQTLVKTDTESKATCFNGNRSYNNGAIVMLFITSVIGLLVVFGTAVEIVQNLKQKRHKHEESSDIDENTSLLVENNKENTYKTSKTSSSSEGQKGLTDFLLCFSLINNTKAILDTSTSTSTITCLSGMRFLSMTWIIHGHSFGVASQLGDNTVEMMSWVPRFSFQILLRTPIAVDTFFFLSGFLVSLVNMRKLESTGKFNLYRYYIHRYIRLTPSYMYALFFFTYIYPLLGDGPFWISQAPGSSSSENCIKYWWTNLLYINNIYPKLSQDQCFQHGWYLGADMQCYVFAPIILYAMYRLKWLGFWLANGVFLLIFFICNAVLIYVKNASIVDFNKGIKISPMTGLTPAFARYGDELYNYPWTRMGPYIVGIMLGYITLHKIQYKGRRKLLWYGVFWFAAIILGMLGVFGSYTAKFYQWKMPSLITYGMMCRFIWGLAVGWVVHACHHGYGGYVNDFLSWNFFVPLAKLTYGIYLIHVMVIFTFYYSQEAVLDITTTNLVFFISGATLISTALAYVLAVCIEFPALNLERKYLKYSCGK